MATRRETSGHNDQVPSTCRDHTPTHLQVTVLARCPARVCSLEWEENRNKLSPEDTLALRPPTPCTPSHTHVEMTVCV